MFNLLHIVNLVNFILLLAVIFLYQRQDLRYKGLIYGWLLGAIILVALALVNGLSSSLYNKFSDFSVLLFWAATLILILLNQQENNFVKAPFFYLFGLVLGLSPFNFAWLRFLIPSSLPETQTGYAFFFSFLYFCVWFNLALKNYFFAKPMFIFSLTVANLPFVYKQLFMFVLNLVHEIFHFYTVVFLLPDHPYLNMWFYLFIKTILDPTFSATLTVVLLVLPVFIFLIKQKQLWPSLKLISGPAQRKLKAYQIFLWRRQVFLVLVWILTASQAATAGLVKQPSNPAPKEVIIDGQNVLIAETNPFTRLEAGKISKYLLTYQGKKIKLLVLKEKNGKYKAALDACAICGWEKGYSQLANGDLLCNLCGTVIPLSSLGLAGGCNPVPLKIKPEPSGLSIKVKEIEKAFKNVKGNLN